MNAIHGGRGLVVAAATAVSGASGGSDAIWIAFITAGGGVAAVIIGPFVTDWVRHRRRPSIDHHAELAAEQAEFAQHLIDEVTALRAENEQLRNELRGRGRRA